jgi:hypothetical protein
MASLAMYDLTCNEQLGVVPDGLVTFGHPITFWGKNSIQAYMQTVPPDKRMRVNACSRQVEDVRMRNRDPDSAIFNNAIFNSEEDPHGGLGTWGGAANPAWKCPPTKCCDTYCIDEVKAEFPEAVRGDCEFIEGRLRDKRRCNRLRESCIETCSAENTLANDCVSARTGKNMFASCDAVGTDFPKTGLSTVIRMIGTSLMIPLAHAATVGSALATVQLVKAYTYTVPVTLFFMLLGKFGEPFDDATGIIREQTGLLKLTAGAAAAGPIAMGAALVAALMQFFSRPFTFKGYFQATDDDFQAAWVKKVHPEQNPGIIETKSCFGFPNALVCHLLDAYSEGMRRHNDFNGGICAKIPASLEEFYKLTPFDDWYADDPISDGTARLSETIASRFKESEADFDNAPNATKYGANQIDYPEKVTATGTKTKTTAK